MEVDRIIGHLAAYSEIKYGDIAGGSYKPGDPIPSASRASNLSAMSVA